MPQFAPIVATYPTSHGGWVFFSSRYSSTEKSDVASSHGYIRPLKDLFCFILSFPTPACRIIPCQILLHSSQRLEYISTLLVWCSNWEKSVRKLPALFNGCWMSQKVVWYSIKRAITRKNPRIHISDPKIL